MLKIFMYILIFFTLYIFYIVNTLIPEQYMDEIFHFPQALKYYEGNYKEWDSKITTPPGLYLFTVAILTPLSHLTSLDVGKIACFRLVNIIFTAGSFSLVYKILKYLHKDDDQRVALLSTFNITIFPVLYFFNFLYYTDCGSTFFILLMYHFHLKKSYFVAAISGALSIFFRQTNIVWIFFVAADETLHTLLTICNEGLSKKDKIINLASSDDLKNILYPLILRNWRKMFKKVFQINMGYIPVALCFVGFVIHNGSVALGDKTAHQVCIHPPQLLYFALFTAFFASPYLISVKKVKKFLNYVASHKTTIFEVTVILSTVLVFMSHVHPYLLADNRHYTFYIWRRLLGRNLALSLSLILVYIFSGWSLWQGLHYKTLLFRVVFVICICIAVVPQKLLEFRYFIIPYVMLRLHLKVQSHWQPYLEFILYACVNFLTLYLFLFQKLPWECTEKSIRIMW